MSTNRVRFANLPPMHNNDPVVRGSGGGSPRSPLPLPAIANIARSEARKSNCIRQRCDHCGLVYAVTFIRQVKISAFKVVPMCGLCRRELGIQKSQIIA